MSLLSRAPAAPACVFALCLIPSVARATDDVTNTPHNLSTSGPADFHLLNAPDGETEKDQICVFCHTPHHGDDEIGVVMWNRKVNAGGGYRMYDSATLDMRVASQPQTVSMACLSCHDGSIAFDALRNGPGPGDYNANAPARGWNFAFSQNKMPEGSVGYLDVDLADDHPISVAYDDNADTMFLDMDSVRRAGLKLYDDPEDGSSDQVECASCHNPHDASNRPFLRKSNAGSDLCLSCHVK